MASLSSCLCALDRMPSGRAHPMPWIDRLTFTSSPTRNPVSSSGAFYIKARGEAMGCWENAVVFERVS